MWRPSEPWRSNLPSGEPFLTRRCDGSDLAENALTLTNTPLDTVLPSSGLKRLAGNKQRNDSLRRIHLLPFSVSPPDPGIILPTPKSSLSWSERIDVTALVTATSAATESTKVEEKHRFST